MTNSAVILQDEQPVLTDRVEVKPSPRPHYPALDGLRAISVFLVITVHTQGPQGWMAFIPGWLGVDVFFILSGFLITILLLKEHEAKGQVSLSAFYLRRVFRIVPVYLVVLAFYVLLYAHRGGASWFELKHALPLYLLFLNEFVNAPFNFTWTLGIEEKFYLFWPLLAFVLFCRSRLRLVAILYALLLAILPWSYTFARSYSGLLLGCGLAVLFEVKQGPGLKAWVARLPVAVPVVLVLALAELTHFYPNGVFLFDPAMLLLMAHLLVRQSALTAVLSSRAFVWVGKRTYSMYLVHGLGIGFIESHFSPATVWRHLAVAVLGTVAALAMAQILYIAVEEPSRRRGKALIRRKMAS